MKFKISIICSLAIYLLFFLALQIVTYTFKKLICLDWFSIENLFKFGKQKTRFRTIKFSFYSNEICPYWIIYFLWIEESTRRWNVVFATTTPFVMIIVVIWKNVQFILCVWRWPFFFYILFLFCFSFLTYMHAFILRHERTCDEECVNGMDGLLCYIFVIVPHKQKAVISFSSLSFFFIVISLKYACVRIKQMRVYFRLMP